MSVSSMMTLKMKIEELHALEGVLGAGGVTSESYSGKVVKSLDEIYKILQEHDTTITAIKTALGAIGITIP